MDDHADLTRVFAPVMGAPGLGLAVSGGADSLAMMILAARWVAGLSAPPRLVVYTLDHGLRRAAAAEAAMVAQLAGRLGLECRVLRWDGPHPATGVQAAARAARYRLIGEAMVADGVGVLLTAHHAEDQAETVLMRLAHGSGIAGLAGMSAFSEIEGVRVFRLFLDMPGAALRAVLAGTGVVPAIDPSNSDTDYERVRWRNALPGLAALGLDTHDLTRFARRAGEAEQVLSAVAEDAYAKGVSVSTVGSLALALTWFGGLAPAIATRVLQSALDRAGGGPVLHGLGAVERLRDQLRQEPFRGLSLHGCLVRVQSGLVHIMREPGRMVPGPIAVAAAGQGVWDGRFVVHNRRNVGTVTVGMARDWNRRRAEAFVGQAIEAPIQAIRSAPVVASVTGEILAFGRVSRDAGISVETLPIL